MPASTPLSRSKSAALSRVLDLVPKGYAFYTAGTVTAEKLPRLVRKFHERYGIGCSPSQRITRKQKGLANAALVLYQPADPGAMPKLDELADRPAEQQAGPLPNGKPDSQPVSWLLLVTNGDGAVWEEESLAAVTDTRLVWLGYELVRHPVRGRAAWSWRRTKGEMEELFALLTSQLNRRHEAAVSDTLQRIANQPGFAGIREQSRRLYEFARQRGYKGELPHLFYLQKVPHGQPMWI